MSTEKVKEGLIRIGLRIRECRKLRGLSLEEVAQRAKVTKGLLSKIENFRAIPSLPVLARVSSAMNVDMADIVKDIGEDSYTPYTFIRKESRVIVERDDAIGFIHQAVLSKQLGQHYFDSIILVLEPDSSRKAVVTEGSEFIYILSGKIEFTIGEDKLKLKKGDALFFDGKVPHVPKNIGTKKAEILAIYIIENKL